MAENFIARATARPASAGGVHALSSYKRHPPPLPRHRVCGGLLSGEQQPRLRRLQHPGLRLRAGLLLLRDGLGQHLRERGRGLWLRLMLRQQLLRF